MELAILGKPAHTSMAQRIPRPRHAQLSLLCFCIPKQNARNMAAARPKGDGVCIGARLVTMIMTMGMRSRLGRQPHPSMNLKPPESIACWKTDVFVLRPNLP
jgi:hypothetical protein